MKVLPFVDVVKGISAKSGVKVADVTKVLMGLRVVIIETLRKKMIFRFRDMGNLRVLPTKQRQARNPQTGEYFEVPAGFRVKFSAGSVFAGLREGKLSAAESGTAAASAAAPKAPVPSAKSDKTKPAPAKPAPAKPAAQKPAKPAPAPVADSDELAFGVDEPIDTGELSTDESAELEQLLNE